MRVLNSFTSVLVSAFSLVSSAALAGGTEQLDARRFQRDLVFEQNCGQAPAPVRYIVRRPGGSIAIGTNGFTTATRTPDGRVVRVAYRLPGDRTRSGPIGVQKLRGVVNQYHGSDPRKWVVGAPTFRRVHQQGVLKGVDLAYYARDNAFEYALTLRPGVSPDAVVIEVSGAGSARVERGELCLETPAGEARWKRPSAFQNAGGRSVAVPVKYRIVSGRSPIRVGFDVGAYDRSRPLTIDPRLVWSTFIGGTGTDDVRGVRAGSGGLIYVAGETMSDDLPVMGSGIGTRAAWTDAWAACFSQEGRTLEWCTYLGGNDGDRAEDLDVRGSVLALTGATYSDDFPRPTATWISFEGAAWAIQGFAATMQASTGALVASTALGNGFTQRTPSSSYGHAVVIQSTGHIVVAADLDLPDEMWIGGDDYIFFPQFPDARVLRLKPNLTREEGTYHEYTQYGDEFLVALAVDTSDCIYAAGYCFQGSEHPPASPGAYQTTYGGGPFDAYVVKLGPNMSKTWLTFFGGGGSETAAAIAVDLDGSVVFVGRTTGPLPVTSGAPQSTQGGHDDGFLARLSADGSSLVYCSYLGGSANDYAFGLTISTPGTVWVVGETGSQDFPVWGAAHDVTHNGGSDGFVCVYAWGGLELTSATFLGGSGNDAVWCVAATGPDSVVVGGRTVSPDFPTTPEAFDRTHRGQSDGFVARLTSRLRASLYVADRSGICTVGVELWAKLVDSGLGTPLPYETISFDVGTWGAGTATTGPDGVATLFYPLPDWRGAGTFQIRAHWDGNALLPEAWGYGTLWASKADTKMVTLDRSGDVTTPVALKAYLYRQTDSGPLDFQAITFEIAGTYVGTATTNENGMAQLMWTITPGSQFRSIRANFAGTAGCNPSYATATLEARTWATKMVVFDRTARITDRTELKCRLLRSDNTPLYNLPINFSVDGTFVITRNTNVDGYASYPYYDIPDGAGAGVRTIMAAWAGNAGYGAINKTATLTVLKALPYIWVLPKSVPQGAIANLYAYFRRLYDYKKQEGKTVSFRIDGTWIADVVTGSGTSEPGVARYYYNTSGLSKGSHTIRCEFAGDAWVEAGDGQGTLNIY